MDYNVYSTFDEASEHFGPLMLCRTNEEAIRNFALAVRTPGNPLHDFPADFKLYSIGVFNDETGHFVPHDVLVRISSAINHVECDNEIREAEVTVSE